MCWANFVDTVIARIPQTYPVFCGFFFLLFYGILILPFQGQSVFPILEVIELYFSSQFK